MKGNNLRLFIDGYAIAAAKSCSIQLQAQTEDESSKDTPLDYQQLAVVGKSATISAEALYVPTTRLTPFANPVWQTISGYKVATSPSFTALPGTTYLICSLDGEPVDAAIFTDGEDDDYELLYSDEGVRISYTSESTPPPNIYFGFANQADLDRVVILELKESERANNLDTILMAYYSSQDVEIKLSTTEGEQNREIVDDIITFTGKITDLSVVSSNRQSITFSCQIQAEMT